MSPDKLRCGADLRCGSKLSDKMRCGPNAKILNIRYSVSDLIYYTTLERSCGFTADPLRARWILRIHCGPVGSCGTTADLLRVGWILRIYRGSTAGPLDLADPLRIYCAGRLDLADLLRARWILRIYRGFTAGL